MWKTHFEKLYNSNVGNRPKYSNVFDKKIKNFSDVTFISSFFSEGCKVYSIYAEVWQAPGPYNIHMEAFIYGGHS